jgi:hypothetical protein
MSLNVRAIMNPASPKTNAIRKGAISAAAPFKARRATAIELK